MNIQAEKLDIIQWLANINDSKIVRQFVLLKKSNEETTTSNLSAEEKEAVDKGIESIKQGRSKSHAQAMEATRKRYAHMIR